MTEKKNSQKILSQYFEIINVMQKEQAITEMKLGLLEKGGMFQRDERISTVCLRDSRMDMQCNLADNLAAVKNYLSWSRGKFIWWELMWWEDIILKVCVKYVKFCTMQKFPTKPRVKLHFINACISYMPSN